ncbi:MAG: hypothetical protein WCK82_00270 [Bacteroidota bacterium]|jgi:hypothetical protein
MKFIRINPKLIKENLAPIAPIQHLDEIDALANTLDDNLGKEVHIPKDVLDSFKIKNTLNPEIWPEGNLNPKVQKNLIKIANGFVKDINLPKGIIIKDVIFTGSLANYNWSKFSDIDLHVILDFDQFDADPEIIQNYFNSQKTLWNQEHDITVFGYPVELYVQDTHAKLVSTAVYSVLRNEWIKKPKREEFKLDKTAIKDKAQSFINQLKDIRDEYKDKQYQSVVDKVTRVKDKIKQMRKAGLESGGEFSLENLAFKVLRRTPFMDILDSFKAKAYDNIMSVTEKMEPLDEAMEYPKFGTLFIKGPALEDGTHRLYATSVNNVMVLDRKKTDDSSGQSARMAVFGNNQVFRVGLVDGRLKALGVAWNTTQSMLEKMGLTKTSVVLHYNKTPLHKDSLTITQIPQAINSLSSALQNIPNIRWVG